MDLLQMADQQSMGTFIIKSHEKSLAGVLKEPGQAFSPYKNLYIDVDLNSTWPRFC